MKSNRLVLIGYRGTGKTTVGSIIAKERGCLFTDMDQRLEQTFGMLIPEWFATHGEASFRDAEGELLQRLLHTEHEDEEVLSTGGGIIVREAHRVLLKQLGTVVYLQASAKMIHARLQANPGARPNLTVLSALEEIETMLAQRAAWYTECADITVDTDGHTPEQVASIILSQWPVSPLASKAS